MRLIENHLGPDCHKILEFSQMDWSKEPFNGGCFLKSLMPGTTKYFNSELREPFDRFDHSQINVCQTYFFNYPLDDNIFKTFKHDKPF